MAGDGRAARRAALNFVFSSDYLKNGTSRSCARRGCTHRIEFVGSTGPGFVYLSAGGAVGGQTASTIAHFFVFIPFTAACFGIVFVSFLTVGQFWLVGQCLEIKDEVMSKRAFHFIPSTAACFVIVFISSLVTRLLGNSGCQDTV